MTEPWVVSWGKEVALKMASRPAHSASPPQTPRLRERGLEKDRGRSDRNQEGTHSCHPCTEGLPQLAALERGRQKKKQREKQRDTHIETEGNEKKQQKQRKEKQKERERGIKRDEGKKKPALQQEDGFRLGRSPR